MVETEGTEGTEGTQGTEGKARDDADGGGMAGQEFLRAGAEGANRPGPDSIVSRMAHRGGGGFPARTILAGLPELQS